MTKTPWRWLRRMLRSRRGAVVVEYALVIPSFLLLMFGIFDLGRMLWVRTTLQYAAEEAGRYVTINPGANLATVTTYLKDRVPTLDPGSINVAMSPSVTGGFNFVTVTATHQFNFAADLVGLAPILLTGESRVPAIP